ncbi:DUF6090 family protein [Lentiprolixibacter aurantiacus]|uniref:DUF6090 family protein n=1 Tax=Lentiprolixibacter aurantiacus TaxID=2993939 RepID=A0AAE3MJ16_9FLAO|nr:DUF6090 family protein [Lentiprolixibacter aurantiacus]MCX2718012.1 DUF6090 family protein [Lentiprolixibacter aurantiacus]
MIKFFRKIRQKLLSEGETGKYFKYALGEIILVVIGILIALQINNWNEERKAGIAEDKALIALKNEFEDNIQRFKLICEARKNAETGLRAYYELISNDTVPLETKAEARRRAGFGGRWSVQNTVLNGLVNSGAIENIKNDSLKTLLTRWPTLLNIWNDEEERWRNLRAKLSDYLMPRLRTSVPRSSDGSWKYFPNNTESELDSQMYSFVNELEYQNYIAKDISHLHTLSLNCTRIFEDYNKIMRHLNIEINSKKIN